MASVGFVVHVVHVLVPSATAMVYFFVHLFSFLWFRNNCTLQPLPLLFNLPIFYLPAFSVTEVQRGNWPCLALHVGPLSPQYLLSSLSLLVSCFPVLFPSFTLTFPYFSTFSLSCLPCLGSYFCPRGVVHQTLLLSSDWASVLGFISSRVQVSSVRISEPVTPQSHCHRLSISLRRLCLCWDLRLTAQM